MLETLKHIITILSCATYDYFFYDFMNYNFLKKQKGNYFVYFSILVFINVIINFFESTFLNYLWSFFQLFIISKVLFEDKTRNTFLPLFFLLIYMLVFELISAYSLEYFFVLYKLPFDYYYYIAMFVSNIIILLFYKPMKNMLSHKSIHLQNEISFLDILILFISFFIVFLFSFFVKLNLPPYLYYFIIIVCILILILDIYLTLILDDKIKNKQLQSELKLLKSQQQLNEQYYHHKNEQYNKQMKLVHDFKSHLVVIEKMYKNGNIDDAKNYSNELINTMNISSVSINNKVLRILMNDFIEQCKTNNIPLHYEIDSRVGFTNIQEMDIVTIYSNLMNNALDASKNCSTPNIHVKVFIHNSMVITEFFNAYSGEIKRKNNRFISTKDDHFGYGLMNIKEIIDKYDGTMDVYYENHIFKVVLILPFED